MTKVKLPSKQSRKVLPFFRKIKSNRNSVFKLSLIFSAAKKPPYLVYYLLSQFLSFFPQRLYKEWEGDEDRADFAHKCSWRVLKLLVRDSASLKPS